uniref:Kinesin motor domain-containing protein n=1 Tax=Schistocephalus solidus TaxID=70667 RepID=A0A183T6Y4_SCHSO
LTIRISTPEGAFNRGQCPMHLDLSVDVCLGACQFAKPVTRSTQCAGICEISPVGLFLQRWVEANANVDGALQDTLVVVNTFATIRHNLAVLLSWALHLPPPLVYLSPVCDESDLADVESFVALFHIEPGLLKMESANVDFLRRIMASLFFMNTAAIVAQGPKGTGKTYTMLGQQEEPGIIPRALSLIAKLCCERSDDWQEEIVDLQQLNGTSRCVNSPPGASMQPSQMEMEAEPYPKVELHDDGASILLRGLNEIEVRNEGEMLELLKMFDKSGVVLGRVLDALRHNANYPKCRLPVPFRDSKLTHLLKPALAKEPRCVLITTISLSAPQYTASYRSLKLASNALDS